MVADRRVLVITCEEGRGHAAVADALREELLDARQAVDVEVVDALKRGTLGRFLAFVTRDGYARQLDAVPWSWGLEFSLFTRVAPARWLLPRALDALAGDRTLDMIHAREPQVLVLTHPTVINIVGQLRATGRLDIPSIAVVPELGAHALWAHPGIDLHLVVHPRAVAAIEEVAGQGKAQAVRPFVHAAVRRPYPRDEARRALGLPADRSVVAVAGGGWGVGDLEGAVRAALALPRPIVVCVSGRNERLRRRLERTFEGEPRLHSWGRTERMNDLLAAADALVDTTVGVTVLEAIVRECPVIAYGTPGHARFNVRAGADYGLLQRAESRRDLRGALAAALAGAAPAADLDDAAARSAPEVILELAMSEAVPGPAAT